MKGAAAAMPRLWLLLAALFALSAPAAAQDLPRLTGRVVDTANLLPAEHEAALTRRLEDLERTTSRQLVVATVPDLGGRTVEDYGFALGEAWKIGEGNADNGAILLVAVSERKVRIEVGDGLEPILTDAMSSIIIRREITPRFKAGDYPGGINAGVNAILEQLRAPPEEAERRAVAAAQAAAQERQQRSASGGSGGGGGSSIIGVIFWIVILVFVIGAMGGRGRRGRRYGTRRRRGGWGASPVIMWGGGWGGGGGGGGFGGFGGSGGGGGFGGFSGGGGSFGGGGASGSW